jgi:hypothetical protein
MKLGKELGGFVARSFHYVIKMTQIGHARAIAEALPWRSKLSRRL